MVMGASACKTMPDDDLGLGMLVSAVGG
jgi:hypothetical protein